MIALIALPLALALAAGIHGLRARRGNLARFEAHSARLRGLPYGRR